MKKLITLLLLITSLPLMAEMKILAFSGSTRAASNNKKLLNEATALAHQMGATVTVIDLKDYPIPFYDADLEKSQGLPSNAKRLRDLMIASDAVIIASPEYNASISAVLKNALDWTSRSETAGPSRAAYEGKKFVIMSASPSKLGGSRGLDHLRAVIEDAHGEVLATQVTVPQAHQAFDANGRLISPEIKQTLHAQMEQLMASTASK